MGAFLQLVIKEIVRTLTMAVKAETVYVS